ncbi:extracellular solute-binding protein [Cohnella caldifontis]|uniref:extracellular solute-binding protein n=1 Tax=Cohnella caldifontis TaxID=3027471 RepID=UPI0023EC592F|nr:extracellular solute-binding protein [Cohnella sp. YIM B05605]
MKIRTYAALPIALILAFAVAACGAGNSGVTPQPAEKITLRMMSQWNESGAPQQFNLANKIIDEFQRANPNITIENQVLETELYKSKLKVLSASNSLPDIGFTWAAGFMEPYVKADMFAPLNDIVDGELKDQFVKGTVEAYSYNGKAYALPVELNIVPVYYNKAIFSKYHLQPPTDFEYFMSAIKILKSNGVKPIALGGKEGWTASFWYMYLADRLGGPDLLDQAVANNDFTDPNLIEAARMSQELVDQGAFSKGFIGMSNDEAKPLFMNGLAAMYMAGTWEVPNYTTSPDTSQSVKYSIGYFKFPTIKGGKGDINDWVGGPGVALFVANHSKHVREAKKFVTYFTKRWGEASVTEAGIVPATKVDTSKIQLPQMYIDLLNELASAKKVTNYLDVQMKPVAAEGHRNLVQALFGKQITPEEFVAQQDKLLKDGR